MQSQADQRRSAALKCEGRQFSNDARPVDAARLPQPNQGSEIFHAVGAAPQERVIDAPRSPAVSENLPGFVDCYRTDNRVVRSGESSEILHLAVLPQKGAIRPRRHWYS